MADFFHHFELISRKWEKRQNSQYQNKPSYMLYQLLLSLDGLTKLPGIPQIQIRIDENGILGALEHLGALSINFVDDTIESRQLSLLKSNQSFFFLLNTSQISRIVHIAAYRENLI